MIDWNRATVLTAAEFDVARDLLDLGRNPAVLELLSPGFTDVERARVVQGCLDTLAARGLFTGTAFEQHLVGDLRTVVAPEFQHDLVVAPPSWQRALVARRAGHGFADGSSRWHLVKTLLDRGDPAALDEAESLVRFLGGEPDVTSWLVAVHTLAGALGQSGDGVRGARLLGAVSVVGGEVGYRPEEMDPQDSERNAALVRAALGGSAERYAAAFTEGVAGGRAAIAAVLDELGDGGTVATRMVGRSA